MATIAKLLQSSIINSGKDVQYCPDLVIIFTTNILAFLCFFFLTWYREGLLIPFKKYITEI